MKFEAVEALPVAVALLCDSTAALLASLVTRDHDVVANRRVG